MKLEDELDIDFPKEEYYVDKPIHMRYKDILMASSSKINKLEFV